MRDEDVKRKGESMPAHADGRAEGVKTGISGPLMNDEIAARLRGALSGCSYRGVAARTGFHHESVRRYMRGESKIPAEFVSAVCAVYGVEPGTLLNDRVHLINLPEVAGTEELARSAFDALRPAMRGWSVSIRGGDPTLSAEDEEAFAREPEQGGAGERE
jgi:transcriptional regulator with XRE-family HTH domain